MKKYKFLYSSLFALLISGASLTSCKDYLDVNDNPNYPVSTTMSALLPSACASTIAQLGLYGDLIGICGFSLPPREIQPTSIILCVITV